MKEADEEILQNRKYLFMPTIRLVEHIWRDDGLRAQTLGELRAWQFTAHLVRSLLRAPEGRSFSFSALAIGANRILPSLRSRRGAAARSVAKVKCIAVTALIYAWNLSAPVTFASSAPQNALRRAITRFTAGSPGRVVRTTSWLAARLETASDQSLSSLTRTVRPYCR